MPLLSSTAVKVGIAAALSLTIAAPAHAAAIPATARTPVTATTTALSVLSPTNTRMVTLVSDMVATMQQLAPPGALPGVWKVPIVCWRCDAGPALALAASSAVSNKATDRALAESIFDRMIATYQLPNGAFGIAGGGGPDIETMFFAAELGSAAIVLKPTLSPARYAAWTVGVQKAADFLVANGNLKWYTNGNITIGNALIMALAARLTGQQRYRDYYDQALRFAVAPPQARWPGFGLTYTKQPTLADGSDGRAYFAENGAKGPGYDPEYTVLQLDLLTKIWLTNGDPRVKTYMNLLLGQLMLRVDVSTWMLDASNGSRHTETNRKIYFDTAAISTLAHLGGRADLQTSVAGQLAIIEKQFRTDIPGLGDRSKYAFGMIIASVLQSQPENGRLR